MKTNLNSLTKDFRTIEEWFNEQKIIYRKQKAFFKWLEEILPFNLRGTYSFDDLGDSCIRCFIELKKDDFKSMELIIKWLLTLKNKRVEVEKFWRKEKGYFAYRIERKYKNWNNYLIFIENGANIDGCKIIESEETRKIFITDCEKDRILIQNK